VLRRRIVNGWRLLWLDARVPRPGDLIVRCILIASVLACALVSPALAQDTQEFRRINLNDGRELLGIVMESTATGMKLRVPQGTVTVGYDKLSDMANIEMGDWMAQPAARFAVAPASVLDEEVRALASDVDAWLPQAAGVVPRTAIVGAADWTSAVGAPALSDCGGDIECLRGLLKDMQIDYLLVPTVKPGPPNRLSIVGVVASTGQLLGTAQVALFMDEVDRTRADTHRSGEPVARAVFDALGFAPDVDVKAAVGAIFPAPEPAVAEVEPEPDPQPSTKPAKKPSKKPRPTAGGTPNRGVSVALGFAPVPGLSSAYLKDGPGFLVSLVGTVGASWGTIYGVGTVARSEDAFWAPNILLPYAINVVFNQITSAVGWRRLYAGQKTAIRLPTPTVVPHPDGGAVLTLAGRF
jgi:hypothetical protein